MLIESEGITQDGMSTCGVPTSVRLYCDKPSVTAAYILAAVEATGKAPDVDRLVSLVMTGSVGSPPARQVGVEPYTDELVSRLNRIISSAHSRE